VGGAIAELMRQQGVAARQREPVLSGRIEGDLRHSTVQIIHPHQPTADGAAARSTG
jgi:hypothetical protein